MNLLYCRKKPKSAKLNIIFSSSLVNLINTKVSSFVPLSWGILAFSQFLPVWFSSYALIILFIALAVNRSSLLWRSALTNSWFQSWAVYYAWLAVSMFWTVNYADGMALLSTQILLPLIPFAYFLRPLNKVEIRTVGRFWYTGAFLAFFIALFVGAYNAMNSQVSNLEELAPYFFYVSLAKPIMHPGYFSLLILGALWWWVQDDYFSRTIKIAGVVFLGCALIMLSSRMILVSVVLTLILCLFIPKIKFNNLPSARYYLAIVVFFVFIFTAFPNKTRTRFSELFSGLNYNRETFKEDDYNSITIRLALWENAFEIIKSEPLLGVGAGDYKDALWSSHARNGMNHAIRNSLNTHNQLLENWLIAGLPYLVLLMYIFLDKIIRSYRMSESSSFVFMLFILIVIQTETVLFWHRGILFFSLFAVLLYHKEFICQNTGS